MSSAISNNILVRLAQAQVQSVDDTLKACLPPQNNPPSKTVLSRLVQIGIRLFEDMENAYTEGYARAVQDASMTVEDLQRERTVLDELFHRGAEVATRISEYLAQISKTIGQPIEESERVRKIAEQFKQLQSHLAEEWPVCSPEEEQAALARGEQEEGIDLADAFAEIAGVDRATWLERVTTHKQKYHPGG